MNMPETSRIRAIFRLVALLVWTICLLISSLMGLLLAGRTPRPIIGLWYRGSCHILGLTVEALGEQVDAGPVLFVANHVSYLDILALGGLLNPSFIAKSDVRDWPAIGWLARLARTVFIDRRIVSSRQQRDAIVERLIEGERLVLFAEGTSSDGSRVLPFKSSLFGAIETAAFDVKPRIQPITIDYAYPERGQPLNDEHRALYAWYGDMALLPHLWRMMELSGALIRVRLHDVIQPTAETGRKALAARAECVVADGLVALRMI